MSVGGVEEENTAINFEYWPGLHDFLSEKNENVFT